MGSEDWVLSLTPSTLSWKGESSRPVTWTEAMSFANPGLTFITLWLYNEDDAIYLDLEVGVQKSLALERHVTLVCHHQRSAQALGSKRNAVKQTKLIGPQLAGSIVKILRGQTKVELYAVR